MARSNITSQMLTDHVKRIGDEHPAIPMDSVDFTVKNPELVRDRFGVALVPEPVLVGVTLD